MKLSDIKQENHNKTKQTNIKKPPAKNIEQKIIFEESKFNSFLIVHQK